MRGVHWGSLVIGLVIGFLLARYMAKKSSGSTTGVA